MGGAGGAAFFQSGGLGGDISLGGGGLAYPGSPGRASDFGGARVGTGGLASSCRVGGGAFVGDAKRFRGGGLTYPGSPGFGTDASVAADGGAKTSWGGTGSGRGMGSGNRLNTFRGGNAAHRDLRFTFWADLSDPLTTELKDWCWLRDGNIARLLAHLNVFLNGFLSWLRYGFGSRAPSTGNVGTSLRAPPLLLQLLFVIEK